MSWTNPQRCASSTCSVQAHTTAMSRRRSPQQLSGQRYIGRVRQASRPDPWRKTGSQLEADRSHSQVPTESTLFLVEQEKALGGKRWPKEQRKCPWRKVPVRQSENRDGRAVKRNRGDNHGEGVSRHHANCRCHAGSRSMQRTPYRRPRRQGLRRSPQPQSDQFPPGERRRARRLPRQARPSVRGSRLANASSKRE